MVVLSANPNIFALVSKSTCIFVTNILIKSGKTMRVIIESDYQSLSLWAANHVARRINEFNPASGCTVP